MNIKALFLDMDGTTLSADQVHISRRNMAAIRRAISQNIQVIPCTGRVLDMYPPQLLAMKEIRYCITCHGARAVDRSSGRTIYENLLSPEDSFRICSIIENKGIYAEIAAQNTIYLESSIDRMLDRCPVPRHHEWYITQEHNQTVIDSPGKYFLENGIGIEKINIYGLPGSLQEAVYNELTATGCIKHTREGVNADLEFSCRSLDKNLAVEAVLKELRISLDECMMIGDSESDLDMICRTGLGIAMQNAPDRIKKQAKDIAPRNDEDGVAFMIEKYLLRQA